MTLRHEQYPTQGDFEKIGLFSPGGGAEGTEAALSLRHRVEGPLLRGGAVLQREQTGAAAQDVPVQFTGDDHPHVSASFVFRR